MERFEQTLHEKQVIVRCIDTWLSSIWKGCISPDFFQRTVQEDTEMGREMGPAEYCFPRLLPVY